MMPVKGLHHYNISAPMAVLEEVQDFYIRVLGLTPGQPPRFVSTGFWLYAAGDPILHLTPRPTGDEPDMSSSSGFLDHLSLSCTGLDAMMRRLIDMDIPFEVDGVPSLSQVQLFLRDPAGVALELNFVGER
jgi:catechol-2,3-dioxygenase